MVRRAKVLCGLVACLLGVNLLLLQTPSASCQEVVGAVLVPAGSGSSQQLLQTGASLTVEDPSESTWTTSKRINGRKRKRRPLSTTTAQVEEDVVSPTPSYQRRRTSVGKERIREPLAALEKEQKLSEIRDKQRKEFAAAVTTVYRDKSYRKPYLPAKKEPAEQEAPKPTADLKNILKNSGGLSLSEILQQKNLSLDDLLKGKQNALLAIQGTVTPTAAAPTSKFSKPVRRITSSQRRENFQTVEVSSTLQTALKPGKEEAEDTANISQVVTVATLRDNPPVRKHLKFPGLSKARISTTPATITSSEEEESAETVAVTTTTTKKPETSTRAHPVYKKRLPYAQRPRKPPSSAASFENESAEVTTVVTTPKPTTTENPVEERLKEKAPETNFVDNFDLKDVTLDSDEQEDAYLKPEPEIEKETEDPPAITDRIDRFEVVTIPKKPTQFLEFDTDDHTDLLELIEDRRSGNRLFKILAQRNMTLEELFDHRRRGSSELHLAQLAENQTQFEARPAPPGRIFKDKLDIVTAFENFPHFNLVDLKSIKPDEIKTDSQGASYFTSITDIEPTDEVFKEKPVKGDPTMQAQRHEKSFNFFPSWKTLALASLTSQENLETDLSAHQKPIDPEEIENDIARAHDLVDLELSGHGFKRSSPRNTEMPSGIRSAIIASTAIVGMSIFTFVAMFVVCRWRQKRRRRLDYTETYNAMKNKLPAVISQQSTLNRMEEFSPHPSPIIFPGSQSSSKLNTMDPNSPEVQDYLYDALRKPF